MPDLTVDPNTGVGTLEIRKGGQIVSSKVINGETVNFDSGGQVVSVVIPAVKRVVPLTSIPVSSKEHEQIVMMMKHYGITVTG